MRGVVLQLPPTDDEETVCGVMRVVVTGWLDDYGKAHPLATISEAVEELNKQLSRLAADTQRIQAVADDLRADAERMTESVERMNAAQTTGERDKAFDNMMRALAGHPLRDG